MPASHHRDQRDAKDAECLSRSQAGCGFQDGRFKFIKPDYDFNVKELEDMKMKEYTLEELSEFNGKNGKTYVVYDGQVYDVSNSYLWEDGTHQGLHESGKDLTEDMMKRLTDQKSLRTILLSGL